MSIRKFMAPLFISGMFASSFVGCTQTEKDAHPSPDGSAKSTSPATEKADGNGVQWEKSWDDARKRSADENKIVMIDFYTSWCGWCKVLDQKTWPDKRVVELSKRLVAVKLDAEAQPGADLAREHKISGFPTVLFLDKAGKQVGRIDGYYPPEEFAPRLKLILDGSK